MKRKILEILKAEAGYISGQAMSKRLGISRTAVWKYMNGLKEEGYVIDSVNKKGYKLLQEPDQIREEDIRACLHTSCFGRQIFYYKETDSTNIRAKEADPRTVMHGGLFIADMQTAGKGRRGHTWGSARGMNIYMTYWLKPDIPIGRVSALTLVAALAVANALQEIEGIVPEIKWPNDVVVNGKKICGILTEMSSEGTDINYVVVGIGVNVNIEEFPEDLKAKATSVRLETGKDHARFAIIGSITNFFEDYYMQFEKAGDMSPLLEAYNALLVNRDRRVIVIEKNSRKEYTAIALDRDGSLLVRDDAGAVHSIISGEVSVRGVDGYI